MARISFGGPECEHRSRYVTRLIVLSGVYKLRAVMNFLATSDAPAVLAKHPVVVWSLTRVWKQGRAGHALSPGMTLEERFDACFTPR